MNVIVATDTNVLVYAEGVEDPGRQRIAQRLLRRLGRENLIVPLQVLGELYRVLVRKAGRTPAEAEAVMQTWFSSPNLPATTQPVLEKAVDLAVKHRLQIFDAIILAAAAEARADLLLSEDMQDGFLWRGVTVVNPFAAVPHPMLTPLLR